MLKEDSNQLKITEKTSGDIVVQLVIDDSISPPHQDIYAHFGASDILMRNWDRVWKQMWHRDKPFTPRTTVDKMSLKEKEANAEYEKYKDNDAPASIHAVRAKKWEGNVSKMQEEGQKKGFGKGQSKNREFVWIPSKISADRNPTYPYDITFWQLDAITGNRPELYHALLRQNPNQLREIRNFTESSGVASQPEAETGKGNTKDKGKGKDKSKNPHKPKHQQNSDWKKGAKDDRHIGEGPNPNPHSVEFGKVSNSGYSGRTGPPIVDPWAKAASSSSSTTRPAAFKSPSPAPPPTRTE